MKLSKMKIGFVFTNYNSSSYTKDLILSLKPVSSEIDCPIIIVDNNSDEDNVIILKSIKEENTNLHLILSTINLGYFRGLNAGIKYIKNNFKEINFIVIGNNDLIFPEDFIEMIKKASAIFEKYPVISPNIITDTGIHQNPHVIKKISFAREFIYDIFYANYLFAKAIRFLAKVTNRFTDRNDESNHKIAQPIRQGHGSCYILGPLFINNFEKLFAPTFLMGEEFFLSIQLKSKNYQVYYEPTIKIIHQCHSSIDKIPSRKMWGIAKESHKEYRKYIKLRKLYKL